MRKVSVFNNVTLDGYICDPEGDMGWAHKSDPEWSAWSEESAGGGGLLMFGRKTYDMMVSYWPTPEAARGAPTIAEVMNKSPKVVFSRSLDRVTWENCRLVKDDPATEVRRLKAESGPDILILGSGSIVSQLTTAGLVDELQLVMNPLVLGRGKTMFEGVDGRRDWKLRDTRSFENGNVVLTYARA